MIWRGPANIGEAGQVSFQVPSTSSNNRGRRLEPFVDLGYPPRANMAAYAIAANGSVGHAGEACRGRAGTNDPALPDQFSLAEGVQAADTRRVPADCPLTCFHLEEIRDPCDHELPVSFAVDAERDLGHHSGTRCTSSIALAVSSVAMNPAGHRRSR